MRGFAEALAENAKDADAALKLLATLTGAERRAVVLCRVGSGTRRARVRGARRKRLAERADDDNDAAAVRRHVASVAPCPCGYRGGRHRGGRPGELARPGGRAR